MTGGAFYDLTVVFSIVTGTAAALLALLTWETLRRSPFGRTVFVLTLVMVLFIVYHVVLAVTPAEPDYAGVVKSAIFTGVTLSIWMLVWSHLRMQRRPGPRRGG